MGEISYEEWLKSLFIIEQLSEEHNCFDLHVDISKQKVLPDTLGLNRFGTILPRNLRYALVCPFKVVGGHRFLETVSASHGNLVSIFRNEQEALAWLKKK